MDTAFAFFDFDGTMCRGDSILFCLRLAAKKRLLTAGDPGQIIRSFLRYLFKKMSDEQMKTICMAFWAKMSEQERRAFDEELAQRLAGRVYKMAKEEMALCRLSHRKIVIVSASTENYMALLGQKLGVDTVLCTKIDEKGHVSGNCKGEEKVRRIEGFLRDTASLLDPDASAAYGDSLSDRPMLRLVSHPTMVNPKRGLRKAMPPHTARVLWR